MDVTANEVNGVFDGRSARAGGKEGMVGVRKEEFGGLGWGRAQKKGKRGTERG